MPWFIFDVRASGCWRLFLSFSLLSFLSWLLPSFLPSFLPLCLSFFLSFLCWVEGRGAKGETAPTKNQKERKKERRKEGRKEGGRGGANKRMRERKRKVEGTLHFWNSGGATSPNRHGNYLRYSLDLDDSDGAATFFLLLLLLLLLLPLPPSLPFKNNCNSIAIKLNSDPIQWNCVRV